MSTMEIKLNIINGASEKYVEFFKSIKGRILHQKITVAKKSIRELMNLSFSKESYNE